MSRTQNQPKHRIRCTECDFTATSDRSKTHAYALGRQHYHQHGHPVTYEEGGSDE